MPYSQFGGMKWLLLVVTACAAAPADVLRPPTSGAAERARTVIEASFVADAAAMSLHWIYDPVRIAELVAETPSKLPEFYDPPKSPYYKYPLGIICCACRRH